MKMIRNKSVWGRLAAPQRKQVDVWLFEENRGYREILELAAREFGIKSTKQSLSKYYQRRQKEIEAERARGPRRITDTGFEAEIARIRAESASLINVGGKADGKDSQGSASLVKVAQA